MVTRTTTTRPVQALVTTLAAALVSFSPARGESNEAAGAFVIRGGSARGAVLGEAYGAAGGDADVLLWNPAALAALDETHLQATYHDVFSLGLARFTGVSLAARPRSEDVVVQGDSIRVIPSGVQAPVFALSMGVLVVDVGEESYWEFTPTIGAAHRLTRGTSVGAAARYLRASSSLSGVSATGYALDLGITQRFSFPTDGTLAVAFRNLLGRVKWKEGREESEPRELVVSGALPVGARAALLGGLATDLDRDVSDRWNVAIELHAVPGRWTLLGGLEARRDGDDMPARAAFGTRIHAGHVRFDYAFVTRGRTPGETHRATVLVGL